MLVIVGFFIVTACVIGGFALAGGNLMVLFQPIELLIIVGAGVGSVLIAAPMSVIKDMIAQIKASLSGHDPTKAEYLELLLLIYELCKTAKANPLSLEPHVEKPDASEIFKRYPHILKNHHVIHFICDTLKIQLSAGMSPYDLEDLMDLDINSSHEQEGKAPVLLNTVGDAMPGLGIVAAVLGVVLTMGKLTQGKEVIGHSVAAALVGTFIGILLSYGFVGPLAAKMKSNNEAHGGFMMAAKAGLLAYAKNCSPKVCAEFGRRSVPPIIRPTFEELDKATSGGAAKAA